MAKKSKTQKLKASAARQARKEEARAEEERQQELALAKAAEPQVPEKPKRKLFKKKAEEAPVEIEKKPASYTAPRAVSIEPEKKEKKEWRIVTFFKDVRAEMKRVTWPTRTDVLRWSGVVIVALLFFGIYVALLDNAIITPILVFISNLGAGA